MCGIAGIFHRNGTRVDAECLVRMTRTLVHRGPDDEGYFVNAPAIAGPVPDDAAVRTLDGTSGLPGRGDVGLGHRRLSIIDLVSGHQPLTNEDGTVWVSFNGEIYNFQSIQRELEAKGHRFRTHCDTEVIVHAYEEWGEQAVERMRGMFAFAVWDERKQRLWLARDRVGKKPLYYLVDENRLIFASEIKAILEAPDIPRELDLTALSDYLSLLYVPAPKSIFSAIRKLPAGHSAIVTADSMDVRPYWDLTFGSGGYRSTDQMADDLLGTLEEATRLRMISDVPLGAFLSGGVDSSAVVAMMSGLSPEPVVTNAISFGESDYDETEYARKVAGLFETEHHEFRVSPEAIPVIERLAWHYDEPFADSSSVPTFYVSETARKSVTVSLSGDGGDESFAGYRRYYFEQRENAIRNLLPGALRRPLFGLLGRLYPKADYLPRVLRGKAFLSNLARDPADAYFYSMSAFHEDHKRRLFAPEVLQALGGYQSAEMFREIYARAPADDHLSKILYLDIKTYLCDDILTKVDRASMAVSLEVRCPLLDHVFMEKAAAIPLEAKISGTEGKRVFKKALERHLPDDVLYRRKMGFSVPLKEWLRREVRDYAGELILEGGASAQLFRREELDRMWKEHDRGLRNWGTELWILMMANLWHRRFLDS